MARAVRLAASLEFEIEPATLAAIGRNAELARSLSGERICAELLKLLRGPEAVHRTDADGRLGPAGSYRSRPRPTSAG